MNKLIKTDKTRKDRKIKFYRIIISYIFLNMRQLNENRKDVNKIKDIELFNDSDFYPFHFLSPFDCYCFLGKQKSKSESVA